MWRRSKFPKAVIFGKLHCGDDIGPYLFHIDGMTELVIRRGLDEPETGEDFVPHKPSRPEKSEGGKPFKLASDFEPAGDQPDAIRELVAGMRDDERDQVLLGVTGSGKTFTMAKVIEELQRPALILAPNKILAAQLYGEFKNFFPENAVEYFVSYYDYYQPEAYVARSDTYIEKESSVNEAIDRMRHSATRSLLERDDVIIVASVSCLYGIGSVETYSAMIFDLQKEQAVDQRDIIRKLVSLQYKRNDMAFARGNFRVRGDNLEIFPSHYEDMAWRISFFGDEIEEIVEFDPLTGSCAGIENYSRFLTGRLPGEPPPTLFEYLPDNALLFVDESHQTVPQIGAMSKGDHRRKINLAEYGFRLPSCIDNRPLRFNEWDAMRPQTVSVSATPGPWEMEQTGGVFSEQVIRPTGLIDPPVEIRPVEDQVDDVINECRKVAEQGYRTLITTLTKRMAEDLTEFMHEAGVKVRYMHSDVETLERIELIRDLRLGVYDVLVGINLLREGLDIPECGLVAILDADKEGFLRSETSLIQTIGRAARNVDGRVILYADRMTGSMERAISETDRRREKQVEYNLEHGITPQSIKKNIGDIVAHATAKDMVTGAVTDDSKPLVGHNLRAHIESLEKQMRDAAADLEFETAGRLRDEIRKLEAEELGLPADLQIAQPKGRSTEGRPGTRKMGYGKTQRKM